MSAPVKFVAGKDPNGIPNDKTGTIASASLHCFCAIVGAGVLALPHATAWLGWVAGPICIIMFYLISLLTSVMLADVFEVNGIEHTRYHHAVRHLLSRGDAIAVSFFQMLNCVMITIAYTITGVTAMKKIASLACNNSANCWGTTWEFTLIFGAAEVFISQVRNLEEAWWVSALGSVTSIMYSTIALVISLAHSGNHEGTVGGITASTSGKAFGVLDALGSIAFAYSFSLILLEVEASIKQPPRAAPQMRIACYISITASFIFYITVAVSGYLANGNGVAGMILASYDGPKWALFWANSCVLAHMLTAYQVFAQPVFDTIESHYKWWALRMQARREKLAEGKQGALSTTPAVHVTDARGAPAPAAPISSPVPASPFDAQQTPQTATGPQPRHSGHLGLDRISMNRLEQRLSAMGSGLGSIDERSPSGGFIAPHERRTSGMGRISPRLSRLSQRSSAVMAAQLSRLSAIAAPYHIDTGLANEDVPLNEDQYFAPFVVRLILRTLYVGIMTLIAIVMPFFSAFVGLIGSLTFFPLAVYFPLACYRKVYPVSRSFSALLWAIWWSMLAVCGAATVAAVRDIIVGWSGYKVFGD